MKAKKSKSAAKVVVDSAPAPSARNRVAVAMPTATPDEFALTRAIDSELEWYLGYGESALSREDVGILPSYAAVRILATALTDEAVRARAHELARTVRGCLRVLSVRHASVLRTAYTPRRWPRNVLKAWGALAPIAVRLAFAEDPWPERSSRSGLEEAVATQLSAALVNKGHVPVARLRNQAARLFGNAIVAYLKVRSLESPALR
jgi:hypothetical protein